MDIKSIFAKAENGALTYEQFMQFAGNSKFADLSEGQYVSKSKYDSDLAAKTTEISTLTGNISTRDADLAELKSKLEAAGTDSEKLKNLTSEFNSLNTKYTKEVKAYQEKIAKQAYEFAVKEFAGTQQFTSQAAKRDFVNSMLAKNLKLEDGKIIGASDFVTSYTAENADAIVVKAENPNPKPEFVNPTPGADPKPDPAGGFKFNFTGVRPKTE